MSKESFQADMDLLNRAYPNLQSGTLDPVILNTTEFKAITGISLASSRYFELPIFCSRIPISAWALTHYQEIMQMSSMLVGDEVRYLAPTNTGERLFVHETQLEYLPADWTYWPISKQDRIALTGSSWKPWASANLLVCSPMSGRKIAGFQHSIREQSK